MDKKNTSSSVIELTEAAPATQWPGSASEAQTRLSSAYTVVNCIDTLKVSLWVEYEDDSDLFKRLEDAKKKAQQDDLDSSPVEIGGSSWNCHRIGTKLYSYRLIRGDVRLLISTRSSTAPITNTRFEIGSMSCWVPGYNQVFEAFKKIIASETGSILENQVSEIHLAADFLNLELGAYPIYEQDLWISKAHYSTNNYYRRIFNAVTVGRGDIMLRIYDKFLELGKAKHKQHFFAKIWGFREYEEKPVTRVEFQIRRPILKQLIPTVSSFDDLKEGIASVWQYCTKEWCRLASKPVDRANKNQSRQDVHTWWKTVQNVEWEGETLRNNIFHAGSF